MKNVFLIVVALSFFGIAGRTPAQAQVADTILADIPFGFTVRNMTLPAGKYRIKRTASSNPGVMEIRSADGTQRLVFLVESAESFKEPDQTKLIFDQVGDQYFLSEIFEVGNSDGVELKKSRRERTLEKEGATLQLDSVTVPAQTTINATR